MAQLLLIRHGQAAAFTDDPDRLTELGVEQARQLGRFLQARGQRFDMLVSGDLRRQRQTAEHVAGAFADAGEPLPALQVDPGWNEYDTGVIAALQEVVAARDPALSVMVEQARAAVGGPEQNRYFQRVFEVVMDAWAAGERGGGDFEAFEDFRARVLSARDRARGAGVSRVAVFTSGGPIGVNVADSLDAPGDAALRVNYRVRNASLTELLFSGLSRLSLDGFNAVPHLSDRPELVTYR